MTREGKPREAWGSAFAKQARSDWRIFDLLISSDHEICHALHYLQMACEKIAKAYRIRDLDGSSLDDLMKSHVSFALFMESFAQAASVQDDYRDHRAQYKIVVRQWKQLAREIERLAPAIDKVARPDNTEYPWAAGDEIIAPCDYTFPNLHVLSPFDSRGQSLLKLIQRAMDEFEDLHIR